MSFRHNTISQIRAGQDLGEHLDNVTRQINEAFIALEKTLNPRTVTQVTSNGGRSGEMSVTEGSVVTVTFQDMGRVNYHPICFILTSDGAIGTATALLPPYATDSRTRTSLKFEPHITGRLYWCIQ